MMNKSGEVDWRQWYERERAIRIETEKDLSAIGKELEEKRAALAASPMAWLFVRNGKVKVYIRPEGAMLVDGHYPLFGQSASQSARHIPAADERFLVPKVEIAKLTAIPQPPGEGK